MTFDLICTVVLLVCAIINAGAGLLMFKEDYQRKTFHVAAATLYIVIAML